MQMNQNSNDQNKKYDLEDRTKKFAKAIRECVKALPKFTLSQDDIRQLIRASGSVGANYIEANESLSKKDFLLRVKICRKEIKECIYWLDLIEMDQVLKASLVKEATELMRIFGAIVTKVEQQSRL
jgi:four helix bundle protein